MTSIENRLLAISRLAAVISRREDGFTQVLNSVKAYNPWFVHTHVTQMLDAISANYVAEHHLINWLDHYHPLQVQNTETLGIVMAGNIPLVGFHDFLCGLVCGYQMKVKLSDKDAILLPYLCEQAEIGSEFVEFVERLPKCDRVIATGSNNSSRYFEYYFKEMKSIIRKNRTSVGVLSGTETPEQLSLLGHDILGYFGLGCRNISTLFLPEGMDELVLFDAVSKFDEYRNHNKYFNNFEYTSALYLLNLEPYKSNGLFNVRESDQLFSRISCVHYQRYSDLNEVSQFLSDHDDEIQCVATHIEGIDHPRKVALGMCQSPSLFDYPDGVDTMNFLLEK